VTANKITALYAAAALTLYYWFAFPRLVASAGEALGVALPVWSAWVPQAVLLFLCGVWVSRTYRKEAPYVEEAVAPKPARAPSDAVARLRRATPSAEGHAVAVSQHSS
jgi:hypothetical protein